MTGQLTEPVLSVARDHASGEADGIRDQPSSMSLRGQLEQRVRQLENEGVGRYCACDASDEALITTLYDTGLSSMGFNAEESLIGGDVDNTFGTATCNDAVVTRNNERFHSEAAIPSSYSFFQEDGTVVRYVYDFVVLTPNGEKMAPLDQLGRGYTNMWLYGKLKPVTKVMDAGNLRMSMHPAVYDSSKNREGNKSKVTKKYKVVSVRVRIVDFFIDNGCMMTDAPAILAVSEHDIYYRLDKAALRYTIQFASFLSLYDLATRISKEFQCNRNRRLSSIMKDMASEDKKASTTWGEPMKISGFSESMVDKALEFIYNECLYQHLFQSRRSSPMIAWVASDNAAEKPLALDNGSDGDKELVKQENSSDLPVDQEPTEEAKGNDSAPAPKNMANDNGDESSDRVADDDISGIGLLLTDLLDRMREQRPFFFYDETFVLPEYLTKSQLVGKYMDRFTVKDVVAPVVKKKKTAPLKREPAQRSQVHTTPTTEPVEIKSKVSGRVIKRNSKLTDSDDLLPRQQIDEPKTAPKRAAVETAPDDSLQLKYQMLVDVEKQCNALALPDDFDYTSYNTASDLSGDDAGDQPLVLLNDFQAELKDARYYPRDIPLRLLKFYGLDDMLDVSNICRHLSANPSGLEPLLPRLSLAELEQSVVFTTSVDVIKPLEPCTYHFQNPKCMCDFLTTQQDWFKNLSNSNQKVDGLFISLIRHLLDYGRVDGFDYHLKFIDDSFDLSDKKKEVQSREIKAGIGDTETLEHFITTHGGCMYRGRFRNISQDSDRQIPYVNSLRWNKRFKRVERLLSATRLHKYSPVSYEYQDDGILVTVDNRLAGVPINILTNSRRRPMEYRVIYPQDVFEVLPIYSKKVDVWQEESLPKSHESSDVIDNLNKRLRSCLLDIFEVEKVEPFQHKPVLGFGFKEAQELFNVNIALQPSMLTEFTWPYLLRVNLFYAVYTCRRKYYYKLNAVRWGDAPVVGMNSIDEEEEEEEDVKEEENQDGDDTDAEDGTQTITEDTAPNTATHSDDEDEEEEDGVKLGRRRGFGLNRYSPYYEFELEWYPDPVRVKHLFNGSISPEAIKVIMEKLRSGSYNELDVKDRLVLLRWLSEVLIAHPNAKKFIDMRNDEFYHLKAVLTKADYSQASVVTQSDTQNSEADKLTDAENTTMGSADMTPDNDQDTTPNVSQGLQTLQGSQSGDMVKKKKPKEIMREVAELEERYMQRNVHLGRDRFYNDYYYFGPELGCRIYVRTLPASRFTAQRASVRSKHLRMPSFGPEKFKFDLSKYAKQIQEEHLFSTESKRGRHKKKGADESGTSDSKQSQGAGEAGESAESQSQIASGTPDNMSFGREEQAVQLVKRRRQKGRKPKMIKPRLRRSREFFDRHPTNFDNVTEYLSYLIHVPPRQCWGLMDSPKDVRMFIDRLSPLTINERYLQAKLLQLEPELNMLATIPQMPVECWKAPTPYGQLLASLSRGIWSYTTVLYDMVESTLLRYDGLKTKLMPNSVDEIKTCYMRLVRFVQDSATKALRCCCGDFDSIVNVVLLLLEVVVLCEFVVARYCNWAHWVAVRPMWHSEVGAIYAELLNMNTHYGEPTEMRDVEFDMCLCLSRDGSVSLTPKEKTLLLAIEEVGLWFRYMHVFHQERMDLFIQYKMTFNSLANIDQKTQLCRHIAQLKHGSLVYFFGGYKEWLTSLRECVGFPREFFTEMLSEFGTIPAGINETSLIKMVNSLTPIVPTETLETHIESVWFFDVPNYGPIVRMVLLSVAYGPFDPEVDAPAPSCEEGQLVQYLQTIAASQAAQNRKNGTKADASEEQVVLREGSHESRRFVVYAPLEKQDDQQEFMLPLQFVAEHLKHVWQISSKCTLRNRKARVVGVEYGAADLWQMLTVNVDGQREMANFWEVSPS